MSTPNRAALLNKIHKVLKRHYKPTVTKGDQPLLESLLLAACLENTSASIAEDVFGALRSTFIDWNEIRVSTVRELSEVMAKLAEPSDSAQNLKGILQSVFESDYSFDLEPLKKQNLGQAVKRLQKLDGASPFVVAYATQTALGGHSIPLDRGTLQALMILGVINDKEVATHSVPGMERAIPKSKGQEFGSLLHELGADLVANPFSNHVRDILLSISPDAKDRLPKRGAKKPVEPPPRAPEPAVADKKKASDKTVDKAGTKAGMKLKGEAPKPEPDKAAAKKKDKPTAAVGKESAKDRGGREKPTVKKLADSKKSSNGKKTTSTKTLSKRKPR